MLYTVGYEGRTLAEFLDVLVAAGVTRVIDVRELPLSRRKGFSKRKLSEALESAGIDYVHLRDAGNPHRDKRHDIELCLSLYRQHLNKHPDVLGKIEDQVAGECAALLCVEADPTCCHRSILADRFKRRRRGTAIRNL